MLKYHIQTVEVGASGIGDISFNSIPQDYDDLYVSLSLRSNRAVSDGDDLRIRVNNSNASVYSNRRLAGSGSSAFTDSLTNTNVPYAGYSASANQTANTFGSCTLHFTNYSSNTAKSMSADGVSENNATQSYQVLSSWRTSETAPITSIQIAPYNGTLFTQFSSASLYGVRRGDDRVTKVSPVAIGGTVSTSGGYTIHTFNSSGTLVAYRPVEVEYLVVAGGGSGGGNSAIAHGAGGAGGYRSSVVGESSGGGVSAENKLSLTGNTSYAVTVGAGGSGVTQTSGSSSSLDTVTSIGGGRGGSTSANDGLTGGSGGGAGYAGSAFGSGTTGQGFAGGTGSSPAGGVAGGGGGGGAGQVGGNTNSSNAGNGGNGVSSLITGSSVTRGGGGGGGSYNLTVGNGGSGGGGAGGNHVSISPVNGTSNTGGGGGAAGGGGAGANGGSGVVIIRYLTPA